MEGTLGQCRRGADQSETSVRRFGLTRRRRCRPQWSLLIPALRERGFDVLLLTLVAEGPLFDQLVRLGVPATLRADAAPHRSDPSAARAALRRARPDLIVTQSINAHVVGQWIARKIGAPHVVTEHAGPDLGLGASPRARAPGRSSRRLRGRRQPGSDSELLSIGYRPDRLSVIHNAVPELTQTRPAAMFGTSSVFQRKTSSLCSSRRFVRRSGSTYSFEQYRRRVGEIAGSRDRRWRRAGAWPSRTSSSTTTAPFD